MGVSDGIHAASDTSDSPPVVANLPPQMPMVTPARDASITAGQMLALTAIAYDVDDAALDGDQVQWQSSLDGALGSGAIPIVAGLSIGEHDITVHVSEGVGASAQQSVRVSVLPEPAEINVTLLYLPIVVR